MTPREFAAFVALCKERFGWSEQKTVEALGCGKNQITRWRETPPPRYIGLAAAAILLGLDEWKP